MKVAHKIWLLPIIAILISSVAISANYLLSNRSLLMLAQANELDYPAVGAIRGMIAAFEAERDILQYAVMASDKDGLEMAKSKSAAFKLNLSEFSSHHDALAKKIGIQFHAYHTAALDAVAILLDVMPGNSEKAIPVMQNAADLLAKTLEEAHKESVLNFKLKLQNSQASIQLELWINLFSLVLTFAVLGVASFFIVRSVMRQIGGEPDYAAEIVNKVARGDLSVNITTKSGDANSLLFNFKAMVASLATIVGRVHTSTDSITTASREIAAGNNNISRRTEEQASSLEETASAMEELTSIVKQNAENAKQANRLAKGASSIAVKGGDVVGKVVVTMDSIHDSSKKIVDIISVIEGIAFQTNILALNAAVEAARAGEQGRGFAVVASEVRSLAQRSATAAKEIKVLIDDSVGKVDTGTILVDEAGKTMEEILIAIKRVTDIMGDISAASIEQSAGIEQVNNAITQIDDVTQQNAAVVEAAAAAAELLKVEAQHLAESVSQFKLGEEAAEQRQAGDIAAARLEQASGGRARQPALAARQKRLISNSNSLSGQVEIEKRGGFKQ